MQRVFFGESAAGAEIIVITPASNATPPARQGQTTAGPGHSESVGPEPWEEVGRSPDLPFATLSPQGGGLAFSIIYPALDDKQT